MNEHAIAKSPQSTTSTCTSIRRGILQRKCACGQHTAPGSECEECRQKREGTMQRAAVNSVPVNENGVLPIVHEVLSSPGQPLDAGTRAFMEPRFRFDFSQVRVHTDARAAESARVVNALAYTVGRDVVFGEGEYEPGTSEGRRLLAHELVHTIQQSQGWAEDASMMNAMQSSEPGVVYEREADQVAERVMQVPEPQVRQGIGISHLTQDFSIQRQIGHAGFPTATFTDFVTKGEVRCCKDKGRGECPIHLGEAKPGDPRPQNGINLVASITGHKTGFEYGFVQVVHS
jgi:hypothetical protein